MAQNKLADLNNHLFAQMERLSDENLKGEDLTQEIKRSKAVSDISKQIVDNARVTLDAVKMAYDAVPGGVLPEQFGLKKGQDA